MSEKDYIRSRGPVSFQVNYLKKEFNLMFQRLVKDERKNNNNNNNSTQKEMMVHNVLVFGSGYGNCQSLRPNDGHDLNKTSRVHSLIF